MTNPTKQLKSAPENTAPGQSPPDDKYHVPSVLRALRIFELLAKHPQECGISEIAELLNLPKNSVFRIVTTLVDRGYLHRDPTLKVYGLTRKLLSLGYAAIDETNLIEKSLDVMRLLRDRTGETTLIGTLTGSQGVVLEQILSPHPIKVMVEIGHHFPLHSAAPGKVLLAFLPEAQCDSIIKTIEFVRFTDRTITDAKTYRHALSIARESGYALDQGEEVEDIRCVAAPVLNHRAHPVAAIWVTGPRTRLDGDALDHARHLVVRQASVISERLGYEAPQPD